MASVECLYLLARQSRFTWQLFYVVFCFDQHCGHAMSMVLGSPYLRRPSRIFDSRYRKIGITLYFPALLLGSMYFQLFQTKTTTIQKGDFVGILLQYGGGSPIPTKKSTKITSTITKNHIKNGFCRKIRIRLGGQVRQNYSLVEQKGMVFDILINY